MADETPAQDAAAVQADSAHAEMVQVYNSKTGERGEVPKANLGKAQAIGWEPDVGALGAAKQGLAQGATLGFADEIGGAALAAAELPQAIREGSLDRVSKAYREGRDTLRDDAAAAHEQHPYAYTAGRVGGAVVPSVLAPAGMVGGAASGALQGLGDTEDLSNPDQVATDVARGATFGAALPTAFKVGSVAARAAAEPLENLAGKALLRSAELTRDKLGARTQQEAVDLAKGALKEPGLVPPVMSLKGATAETLAENAQQTKANAGQALGDTYRSIQGSKPGYVSALQLGKDISAASAAAVRDKPELAKQVLRAVRLLDPDGFDAAVASRLIPMKTLLQQPWLAISPKKAFTLEETQDILNRLRGLGAYPKGSLPSAAELTAKKDVFGPAWDTGAEHLRDAAERMGGPEARSAVEAARSRYGMNEAIGDAASKADKSGNTTATLIPPMVRSSVAGAAGAALGGPLGVPVGMVAEHLAEKVALPRAARAIHNVAQSSGQVPDALRRYGSTFGRLFANQPPERRVQIDHRMQELSPPYRKLRAEADKAHAEKERNLPDEPKRGPD